MAKDNRQMILIAVIGVLFAMSIIPGQGIKAGNQQAMISYEEYPCTTNADCPTCVGGGIEEYNVSNPTYLGELSGGYCSAGKCVLSDSCLIWSCPESQADCKSVKQTLLDNTIGKFNQNPMLLVLIIGLIIAFLML